jgi:hypothetical protein
MLCYNVTSYLSGYVKRTRKKFFPDIFFRE